MENGGFIAWNMVWSVDWRIGRLEIVDLRDSALVDCLVNDIPGVVFFQVCPDG